MPRVIMFNTISVDGSIKDYELDIGLHYEVADRIKADAHLIGSETARTGVESFTENVPPEAPADFNKPIVKEDETKPFWVLVDSRGKLKGMLHVYRRSCYCKDIIVIVTSKTPEDYINYMKERNFNMIVAGDENIDFKVALDKLSMYFGVRTVLTDSGGGLTSVLLSEGLVDEMALLISPVIVGKESTNLFRFLEDKVNLELIRSERIRNNHLLVVYRVLSNIAVLTQRNVSSERQHL
ncbi:MAG: dihydrofolate reductase family protein [Candidatus Bathyarchaeia archaeon]